MDNFDKPSKGEDEYFAKQEIERRKKWAAEQAAKMAGEEKQRLKDLHYMKCPKCGMDMQEIALHGVKVDQCPSCGGIYFDAGEIEQMMKGGTGGVMDRVLSIFR